MLDKMTNRLDFHGNALLLRAERQRAIASNIANADTPGYVARDLSLPRPCVTPLALPQATAQPAWPAVAQGFPAPPTRATFHCPRQALAPDHKARWGTPCKPSPAWTTTTWTSTGNAPTSWTTPRYEATLRFLNGQSKTMLSAIQGQ